MLCQKYFIVASQPCTELHSFCSCKDRVNAIRWHRKSESVCPKPVSWERVRETLAPHFVRYHLSLFRTTLLLHRGTRFISQFSTSANTYQKVGEFILRAFALLRTSLILPPLKPAYYIISMHICGIAHSDAARGHEGLEERVWQTKSDARPPHLRRRRGRPGSEQDIQIPRMEREQPRQYGLRNNVHERGRLYDR